MSSNSQTNNEPGGGNAFLRVLRFLIRLTLTMILVLALASLLWFGWQELDRWMDSMSRRTLLLETDKDFLLDQLATSQAQLAALSTRLSDEQENAATLDSAINLQAAAQETALFRLEELVFSGQTMSETVNILGAGVIDLQADVNENLTQIDQIGGRSDAALIKAAAIETQLATLEAVVDEPGEEVLQLKEALRWFRLWELVSRARLRIIENNPGLAAADVEQAILTTASTQEDGETAENEELSGIVSRLELALSSLPDDPGSAERDLESAWLSIDQILIDLLGIERAHPEIEGTLTPTLNSEPQGTPTIEAAATSTPISETPNATPTPEG